MIAPLHRKRIVFAGGGTGGHLYPALALARSLPSLEPVFLVPRDRGDEQRLNGEFRCVPMASPRFDRAPWLYPARLAVAVARARRVLRRQEAAAVVGLGGYASVPAALAARTLGLPVYLVECNAVPGKATRFLSRYAAGIGLASESARESLRPHRRCRVTGTPLRGESRGEATPSDFGLEPGLPTLLVLGGSQGAVGLNTRVVDGLAHCTGMGFQVLHCAGERDAARVRSRYDALDVRARVIDFLPDIGRAYAVADLLISRAGASTVAETLALGLPAVFVPYPWHKDHQQAGNARLAEATGAARIVEEADLDPPTLRRLVCEVLLDENERARMAEAARGLGKPEAARSMAAHLLESLGEAVAEPVLTAELGG